MAILTLALLPAAAQSPASPDPQNTPAPPPGSSVLFSRDADAPPTPQTNPASPAPPAAALGPGDPDPLHVTEAERDGLIVAAYDLDVHLTPADHGIRARAVLTLRTYDAPALRRIVLQLSSTLRWDAISLVGPSGALTPLVFTTRPVDTDADHTGEVSEAVIPLPPSAFQTARHEQTLSLVALYSGTIPQSANRLTRIGAPAAQADASDWDSISPTDSDTAAVGTALRGFGNVLWYPVAAPPAFLGDRATLFNLIASLKLRSAQAPIRLRLSVEYTGEPPDAAYFCGRREPLLAISDNADLPAAEAPGIATATFDTQPLGFRTPSLFITARAATLAGPPGEEDLIAAVTAHEAALPAYTSAAAQVVPLLADWLGPQPLTAMTLLDHPGDPFEDDALLVKSLAAPDADTADPDALVHSLTHAWIRSSHAWIDEGLPEFMSLLWTEHTQGRPAALAQLASLDQPLALAEPAVPADNGLPGEAPNSPMPAPAVGRSSPEGYSLSLAGGEIFYRNKAAAVWWMLRAIAGDDALRQALQTYRKDPRLDQQPGALERAIESAAHMDLAWFFRDWVYADHGLPDLSIANVTPSQLEPNGAAAAGWLVAVSVHNDGYPEVEVPVMVRGGGSIETRLLRVPGHATASVRIVFAGRPEQVQVNDGTVPEIQSSTHSRELALPGKQG